MRTWAWLVAAVVLLCSGVVPVTADAPVPVYVDTKTGVYHARRCTESSTFITVDSLVEAEKKFRPCPRCCNGCPDSLRPSRVLPAEPEPRTTADPDLVRYDSAAGLYHSLSCTLARKTATVARLSTLKGALVKCPFCLGPEADKQSTEQGTTNATSSGSSDRVYVKGYTRKDGTYVAPHTPEEAETKEVASQAATGPPAAPPA